MLSIPAPGLNTATSSSSSRVPGKAVPSSRPAPTAAVLLGLATAVLRVVRLPFVSSVESSGGSAEAAMPKSLLSKVQNQIYEGDLIGS